MSTQKKIGTQRQYFIDWLRIALIISVFFFHVGMIFRPEKWHVNSIESFPFLDPIMWWLHLWRMPLLFLVSGVGTYYAIGRRSSWQYVKERFTRLYIPFTFGFFTLVPLMVYVERIPEYTSLADFIPHMFDGGPYPVGNISWHHLWFILYLFIISLMISPFLKFTKQSHYRALRMKLINLMTNRMGLNYLLILIILSQLILRQYFPNSTHALYNDWAYFTYYLIFFISGFVLFTSTEIIDAIVRDRKLYLSQTLMFTAILFLLPFIFQQESIIQHYTRGITEMIISLSCSITAISYFKKYFNKDHTYRKVLNEGIYPFYILHQPALIFVGFFVLQWDISYGLQAILITLLSLVSIVVIYWFIIRKYNVLRLFFGLKMNPPVKRAQIQELQNELSLDK